MENDSSYFEDTPDPESPAEDKSEGIEEMENSESKTALVPTSVFGDKKPMPGDTCTFKVVKCHEDECQLEYVSRGTSEDTSSEEASMPSKDEMMGDMG